MQAASFRFLIILAGSLLLCLTFFLPTQPAKALDTADILAERVLQPWTGDLSGMRVSKRNVIRVLVPYSRIFLFLDKGEFRGTAVELLRQFEKMLNEGRSERDRTVVAIIPTRRDNLITDLAQGHGDMALGNLTITEERLALVDFSDPLLAGVSELLVTGPGHPEINSIENLSGIEFYVRPSSSYYASLQRVSRELEAKGLAPVKIIDGDELLEDGDILEMINAGMFPATIVDSHKLDIWTQIYENLKVHEIAVREDGKIGWAFRKNSPELAAQINAFVKTAKRGTLLGNIIFKRYLENSERLQATSSARASEQFLALKELFQRYGKKYQINWHLIAAQSFQESRFDNTLNGRTGAVGLMQIKPSTAADPNIGINDISTPESNVHAGVKYLRFIADHYFDDPKLDDFNRILFALAAYNVGPNKLVRLRDQASNPNEWFGEVEWEVSNSVGAVPVEYVRKIYMYYLEFRGVPDSK